MHTKTILSIAMAGAFATLAGRQCDAANLHGFHANQTGYGANGEVASNISSAPSSTASA